MLAAWTILVNRRQKKPIFTDPTIDLGAEIRLQVISAQNSPQSWSAPIEEVGTDGGCNQNWQPII